MHDSKNGYTKISLTKEISSLLFIQIYFLGGQLPFRLISLSFNLSHSTPLSVTQCPPCLISPPPFWAAAPKGAMSYRIGGFCAYVRPYVPPSQASGAFSQASGASSQASGALY